MLYNLNSFTRLLQVFAMVVPETATIKERTLYSSTRGSIIGFIDAKLGEGNAITKKFELDHIKEFNMAQLKYEFGFAATGSTAADGTASSSTSVSANKFSKPSKPGRGAQRVTQQ